MENDCEQIHCNVRQLRGPYLDTWRHGNIEVTEHVLVVLILGGLAQERQKSSWLFAAVSHLRHTETRYICTVGIEFNGVTF